MAKSLHLTRKLKHRCKNQLDFSKVKAINDEELAERGDQLSFQQTVILRTVDTNWSDHMS